MATTAEVIKLPMCDFCGHQAAYDAKTVHGPWAFMCRRDFELYGPGKLGLGIGQKLVVAGED